MNGLKLALTDKLCNRKIEREMCVIVPTKYFCVCIIEKPKSYLKKTITIGRLLAGEEVVVRFVMKHRGNDEITWVLKENKAKNYLIKKKLLQMV